ncbi:hypothetical protein NL676_010777 [Syzygium grande]|nr:hypothetical protein NL676_010777 [Syzygium grande]
MQTWKVVTMDEDLKKKEELHRTPLSTSRLLPHLSIRHRRALTKWKIAATCRRWRLWLNTVVAFLRHALENGDLISENKKDSDGGFQINSPTSEDHPPSLNEGNEDLNCGESPSPLFTSMNEPLGDVEEAVGDETDGQGTELKSKRILIVKVVKKEETEEELENADICIERPESVKELYNGESESLPVANSAEQLHEVVMTPRVAQGLHG